MILKEYLFGKKGIISPNNVLSSENTVVDIGCPTCDFACISTKSSLIILSYFVCISAFDLYVSGTCHQANQLILTILSIDAIITFCIIDFMGYYLERVKHSYYSQYGCILQKKECFLPLY